MDSSGFVMQRPTLHGYAVRSFDGMTIEGYRSEAGEMRARSSRHRITLNRTSHRRYVHRFGEDGPMASIARPRCTLGFEPAGTSLYVDGDEADYLSIFQDPDIYHDAAAMTARSPDLLSRSILSVPDPLTLHVVDAIATLIRPGSADDAMLAEQLGRSLALCVLRLLDRAPSSAPSTPAQLNGMQRVRVISHIEDNLGSASLTIAELAAVAHVSPFHFARAFKTSIGSSPHRYVVERRIARAKSLIGTGRHSLAEVALLVGFADQAHLSTVFRRETGITPGRFRAGG